MPPEFVKKTLSDGMLKASSVDEFNDPFEFRWAPKLASYNDALEAAHEKTKNSKFISKAMKEWGLTRSKTKKLLKKGKPKIAKTLLENVDLNASNLLDDIPTHAAHCRLICFVEDEISQNSDMLMWSHYTGGHKGVRLHMNIESPEQAFLERITYQDELVEVNSLMIASLESESRQAREKAMFVKSRCWEYEREVRLLLHLDHCKSIASSSGKESSGWLSLVNIAYGNVIIDLFSQRGMWVSFSGCPSSSR
jgi:hypothetical protein